MQTDQADNLKSWLKNVWQGKLAFKDLSLLDLNPIKGKKAVLLI